MSFPYALVNPRIIKGLVSSSLVLGQNFNDHDGKDLRLDYEVEGRILEYSRHPGYFNFYSQLSRVDLEFAPTYDEINEGYSGSLKLNNNSLPASLNYHHRSTESKGLVEERRHESDALHLSVSNRLENYSHTTASYRFSQFRNLSEAGPSLETNSVNVNAANTLSADQGVLKRNLRSRYSYRVSEGDDLLEERRWEEDLVWGLGKALTVGGNFSQGRESGNGWDISSRSGSAYLNHRLYQSLSTNLSGFSNSTDFSQGYSREIGGRAGVDYSKKLPNESQLHVGTYYSYAEIENNLEEQTFFILDETHVVPELPSREIALDRLDIEPGSIVVRNAERTVKYRGGLDFVVEQDGRLTRIVLPLSPPPSPEPIVPGKVLSIDYAYRDNPDVRYANRTFGAAANLSLFKARHAVNAGYTASSQDLISGQSQTVGLAETQSYFLNYRRIAGEHTFGAGMTYFDASSSDRLGLTSFYRYSRRFYGGSWSFLLKDQYRSYQSRTDGRKEKGWRNSFNAVFDYRRVFLNAFDTSVRGNYLYQQWEESSHNFFLHGETRFLYGLTQVHLQARLSWDRSGGDNAYSEFFGLQLSRNI